MKILLVHPDDSVEVGARAGSRWDLVVDLGWSGRHVYSRQTERLGVRVFSIYELLDHEQHRRRLRELLALGLPAPATVERMLEEALARGGRDNLTALLLELNDSAFPLPVAGEPIRLVQPAVPADRSSQPDLLTRLGRILGRHS